MKNLPEVTLLGIDCVNVERLQLALDISCAEMSFGAVKLLTSLPTDDTRAVMIEPLTSIEAYSQFCLRDLYRYVDTPYVLIVQHDGFILNANAWDDSFLDYNYIGAPIHIGDWATLRHDIALADVGTLVVGNGGFSLRSAKLLKLTAELSQAGNFTQTEPEDWAQCYVERAKLEGSGITFAPVDVAERFSFEGRSQDYYRYQDSFGFHSFKWTDISSWLTVHPEYQSRIHTDFHLEEYYAT